MGAVKPWSFSALKLMAKSPAHFAAEAQRETTAMERGTAFHALVLGGPPVIGYPGAVRRGKEYDKFVADNPNALILTEKEAAKANAMAAAVRACPEAVLVLTGKHEVPLQWQYLGHPIQTRGVDCIGNGFITELKSTVDSSPERFARQAFWMGYLSQLALYMDAVVQNKLGQPEAAFIVAVESAPPHVVTVLRLTDRALEQGRKVARLWAERALACEAAGTWPGYVQSVVDLDVPEDDVELVFPDEASDE